MSRFIKPLVIVLALPILVSMLGLLGRARWESRWDPWLGRQMAIQRVLPYGGLLARPSLSTVCADGRTGSRFPPCATYGLFSTAILSSAVVGGAGLAFLAGLVLAGRWCRGSMRRMVGVFRPALVATALGTAILGVGHGLLAATGVVVAAGALWFEPLERVSGSWLLVAGAIGLGWALAVATVAFSLVRRPTASLVGHELDLSEQNRLAEVIRKVSAAVGAEPPENVVACLVPWLFVTDMNVTCLDRRVTGRTLCLSLPLARILSVDELRGLLAHDLAHYSREQVAFTTRVASPRIGVTRAMHAAVRRSRGMRALVWEAPLALLSVFVGEAGAGNAEDGERERAADAAAAAVVGREAFAAGLVKLAAFTPAWHPVFTLMQNAAYADMQYVNVSTVFQQIAASNADDERLTGVGLMVQGHPVDRHAMLGERLGFLGVQLREVTGAALATVPQPSAATLVERCEAIEQRLSIAEHELIIETGGRIPRL
jgi:Zn-dependent protease with chaperone function